MFVESKGFDMHSSRSPVYGETLAHHGLPYPLDFSKCYRMCVNRVITPLR
jgi:hypothetical protein